MGGFLVFVAIVALILHFGFWSTLGGFLLGVMWIAAAIAGVCAFVFAIFYILAALGN